MIRITQSYTIQKIVEKLTEEGYIVIYTDFPHGRRSGIGIHGEINLLFERLFDRSPDILAYLNNNLILVEVDHNFKKELITKYLEYDEKRFLLLKNMSKILSKDIQNLEFGFGIIKKHYPNIIFPFQPYHKFYLNNSNEIIHEV